MLYCSADHARWQQMPFILGFTVKLSGNHPCEDICDVLQGDYPKDFKFVGWHPWCRCYMVAKLPSDADFLKYAESEGMGNYQFKGVVKDVPPQFAQWVQDNQHRIMGAKSLPYFLKDNGKISNGKWVYTAGKGVRTTISTTPNVERVETLADLPRVETREEKLTRLINDCKDDKEIAITLYNHKVCSVVQLICLSLISSLLM